MSLSKRQKSKRIRPPRVKRMKRLARLQSAKKFLATFSGENILKGYCKHFAVDWRCGAIELRLLGIALDPNYLGQREQTERTTIERRKLQRHQRHTGESDESLPPTAFDAWLDENYALHEAESFETDVGLNLDRPIETSDGHPILKRHLAF